MNDIVKKLHPLERKVLPFVTEKINSVKNIVEKSKMQEVEVQRALLWLENKKLVVNVKNEREVVVLAKNGEKYLKEGFPEIRFLKAIEKASLDLKKIKEVAKLDDNELSISIGKLKREKLIEIKDKINITKEGRDFILNNGYDVFLKSLPLKTDTLNEEQKYFVKQLTERKEIIENKKINDFETKLTPLGKDIVKENLNVDLIESLNSSILLNKEWKKKEFRQYDVSLNVGSLSSGKRHFVNQAIDYARRTWMDMGFKEMQGSLVQTSFWTFDALFTPQDHPVREMQDTFFLNNPEKGKLPGIYANVKKMHEEGYGKSKGWQYKWNLEEAKKNVLRTHTTSLSAHMLASLTKKDIPGKYFAIGKCFRNETLDWKHLFEFNQTEGIVIDENVNFRDLLGYLKEFFKKMGFEKARFRPAYFAYTSHSTEIDVFHPVHKEWIELGGAGIMRPEVTIPIIGKDIPVLAWGPGFDRLILDYYKIQDIRMLYKNDIKHLREIKAWMK
ncbi:phenylalanine--tRNA ligase subunit alpha [Candidatus Woesearchaeota archaeon]|nr:phenylalanine--tRNA ligase subunit alpha [Candidatus Woesearchaeota archaeon]